MSEAGGEGERRIEALAGRIPEAVTASGPSVKGSSPAAGSDVESLPAADETGGLKESVMTRQLRSPDKSKPTGDARKHAQFMVKRSDCPQGRGEAHCMTRICPVGPLDPDSDYGDAPTRLGRATTKAALTWEFGGRDAFKEAGPVNNVKGTAEWSRLPKPMVIDSGGGGQALPAAWCEEYNFKER